MDAIKVETQGERLVVQAPFHPDLPAKSRDLGGRWDARQTAWTFDVRDEAAVREMLVSIFGTDGSPVETTTVLHQVTSTEAAAPQLWLYGRKIAERLTRDSRVRLGEGVRYVNSGETFPSRGGSTKYPALEGAGIVLEIRDVPVTLVEPTTKSPLADVDTNILIAELERRGYQVVQR